MPDEPRAPRDPFEQLVTCHRRLEDRLRDLAESELEPRDAAVEFLGWFDRAMVRHEQDEETSLFPRVAHVAELAPALERLRSEHARQHALVERLRAFAVGTASENLAQLTRDLEEAYAAHVAFEERDVFPAAEAALGPAERGALGLEMEARRGGGGGGRGGRGPGQRAGDGGGPSGTGRDPR